jgi:hypothetical protein
MSGTGRTGIDAKSLLDIARHTLLADIVPVLSGEARFKALMVANAMAIAAREVHYGPVKAPGNDAAIVAAIRAGLHDGDTIMARRLQDLAQAKCRISSKTVEKAD